MAPKPKFQEGEKVLCYHGPLLYEAKCMKVEVKEGKVQYLIHYNGWNKNWDEWVQESRVVKNNEAGIQKQRELLKNHGNIKGAGSRKEMSNRAVSSSSQNGLRHVPEESCISLSKKTKTAKKLEKGLLKQQKTTTPKAEKEKGQVKEKEKEPPKEKESKEGKEKEKPAGKEKPAVKEKEKKEKEARQRPATPQPSAADKKREREGDKDQKEKKEDKEKVTAAAAVVAATTTTAQSSPLVTGATPEPSAPPQAIAASGEPKRKRTRLDATIEPEETYLSKIEVKIKIPEDLKPVLVDDWDLITRQKMLVTLPCKQTVDDIIEDYIKIKTTKNSNINKDAMVETMLGCKDYFNVMLGAQLLYKFERPQYGEILSEYPDKPMSSIYGSIHFLRLFVRLGAMLAYTSLDERTVHILLNHVHDFLKYLSKNGPNLFKISNYEIATPDYHRKAI